MRNVAFVFLILALGFSACTDKYEVELKQEVADSIWEEGERVDFEFTIDDTLSIHNLYLAIEHDESYSYQNLYVQVYTKFPEGDTIQRMVSLELNHSSGTPYGECSGERCVSQIALQQGTFFPKAGKYQFGFEQYDRKDKVRGIHSLALQVEKTEDKRTID